MMKYILWLLFDNKKDYELIPAWPIGYLKRKKRKK